MRQRRDYREGCPCQCRAHQALRQLGDAWTPADLRTVAEAHMAISAGVWHRARRAAWLRSQLRRTHRRARPH